MVKTGKTQQTKYSGNRVLETIVLLDKKHYFTKGAYDYECVYFVVRTILNPPENDQGVGDVEKSTSIIPVGVVHGTEAEIVNKQLNVREWTGRNSLFVNPSKMTGITNSQRRRRHDYIVNDFKKTLKTLGY